MDYEWKDDGTGWHDLFIPPDNQGWTLTVTKNRRTPGCRCIVVDLTTIDFDVETIEEAKALAIAHYRMGL